MINLLGGLIPQAGVEEELDGWLSDDGMPIVRLQQSDVGTSKWLFDRREVPQTEIEESSAEQQEVEIEVDQHSDSVTEGENEDDNSQGSDSAIEAENGWEELEVSHSTREVQLETEELQHSDPDSVVDKEARDFQGSRLDRHDVHQTDPPHDPTMSPQDIASSVLRMPQLRSSKRKPVFPALPPPSAPQRKTMQRNAIQISGIVQNPPIASTLCAPTTRGRKQIAGETATQTQEKGTAASRELAPGTALADQGGDWDVIDSNVVKVYHRINRPHNTSNHEAGEAHQINSADVFQTNVASKDTPRFTGDQHDKDHGPDANILKSNLPKPKAGKTKKPGKAVAKKKVVMKEVDPPLLEESTMQLTEPAGLGHTLTGLTMISSPSAEPESEWEHPYSAALIQGVQDNVFAESAAHSDDPVLEAYSTHFQDPVLQAYCVDGPYSIPIEDHPGPMAVQEVDSVGAYVDVNISEMATVTDNTHFPQLQNPRAKEMAESSYLVKKALEEFAIWQKAQMSAITVVEVEVDVADFDGNTQATSTSIITSTTEATTQSLNGQNRDKPLDSADPAAKKPHKFSNVAPSDNGTDPTPIFSCALGEAPTASTMEALNSSSIVIASNKVPNRNACGKNARRDAKKKQRQARKLDRTAKKAESAKNKVERAVNKAPTTSINVSTTNHTLHGNVVSVPGPAGDVAQGEETGEVCLSPNRGHFLLGVPHEVFITFVYFIYTVLGGVC